VVVSDGYATPRRHALGTASGSRWVANFWAKVRVWNEILFGNAVPKQRDLAVWVHYILSKSNSKLPFLRAYLCDCAHFFNFDFYSELPGIRNIPPERKTDKPHLASMQLGRYFPYS
jgi:hypothetical protein